MVKKGGGQSSKKALSAGTQTVQHGKTTTVRHNHAYNHTRKFTTCAIQRKQELAL